MFKRKADPISERSQALKQEIAALEAQIRQLSVVPESISRSPEPLGGSSHRPTATQTRPAQPKPGRVLKQLSPADFKLEADPVIGPGLEGTAGTRPGFLSRLVDELRGKPTSNPKLVTFLAAGSIQGLRPLRYEKRIARNRLLLLCIVLLFFIWGILAIVLRR